MHFVSYTVRMDRSGISTIGVCRLTNKGTKSFSSYTQCIWNELELVSLTCVDQLPRALNPLRLTHNAYGTKSYWLM